MTNIVLPIITDSEWDAASDCLSKSRLTLFKQCGIRYRKQYIEKCVPYTTSHAADIGTRFHRFYEIFMMVAHKYPVEQWPSFIHPDFTAEEVPMLEWMMGLEIKRYNESPEYFTPIAVEYRIVDNANQLRGIIDRIDQIDESTISVIEYKTTQSVSKSKLQLEFGFYDILLDSIEELKGMKRIYTVINPRLQRVVSFNPSRRATIMKKVEEVHNAIATNSFKPACGLNVDTMQLEYSTNYCTLCSLEEIAQYNGLVNYRFT